MAFTSAPSASLTNKQKKTWLSPLPYVLGYILIVPVDLLLVVCGTSLG